MFIVRNVVLCLLACAAHGLMAQPANSDCAHAAALCAGQPVPGSNTGALNPGMPAYCQPGGQMVWYSFTTNSVGGVVYAHVGDLQCQQAPNMDNRLAVVFLTGDGSCVPGSFQNVSGPCQQDSVPFSASSVQALQPNRQYWLVVMGRSGPGGGMPASCDFTISVDGPGVNVVNVDFDAGPDVTIPVGGSAQLHATGGSTYEWSPTSGLSGNTVPDPVAQPNETTVYTVTTTLNGCTFEDRLTVWVRRLINPVNTFTPNGDGINDTWDIPELRNFPQAEVSVFDRWGQRVFHSIGYKEPFDGGGLPMGTYYWYIQVNDVKGKSDPYTGYVTLVR